MVARPDASTLDALERELAAARAERDAAQAREAALAEVLQAINASSGDPAPVFDMIIGKAMALCDAAFGALLTYEGEHLTLVAHRNSPPALAAYWETPQYVDPAATISQVLREGTALQIVDLAQSENYRKRLPMTVASVELGGIRTLVEVPLRGERGPIGLFILYRREVRPFTDRQLALVEAFAAQAVLAMENARLLIEQREALEQQTATAEVLQVINSSPGELEPVFDAMLEKAMRLCEAAFGVFGRFDGKLFEAVASRGVPAALMDAVRRIESPPPNSGLGQLVAGAPVAQLADLAETEVYRAGFIGATALVDIAGARSAIFVALRKDDALVGAIVMYRREVRHFTAKQIALLQNFAAQAVIAMENARLLTEQREALEQQTATADILRVISQSPTDVRPVLDAVVRAAVRFCGAEDAIVGLRDGDRWSGVAHEGPLRAPSGISLPLDHDAAPGRSILEARVIQYPDAEALDPIEHADERMYAQRQGFRAVVCAPMLRDGSAIGAVALRKREPGAFTPRQIGLLETFAAQAVIAIENVRLFTELREALDQQTASAEILHVISQSPTDVQPVLDVVAKAAQRFCGADDVVISLRDGDELAIAAHDGPIGAPPPRRRLDRSSTQGRAVIDATTIHLPDIKQLNAAEWSSAITFSSQAGAQAAVAVPMLREGTAIGAIMLRRTEPGPFSPRQIELLEIFAAQAVIAIENVRLFTELREALEQQTATSEILGVISQSPTNVDPVLAAVAKAMLRFCGGEDAVIGLRDGDHWLIAGHEGTLPASLGMRVPLDRQTSPGAAILDARTTHFPDISTLDPVEFAASHDFSRRQGFRAAVAAPMLREGAAIGAVVLRRAMPGAFTPRQIELLEGFAAQAVIAIENTRLFTELKEALEQQTATTDILQAINGSPGDVQPVFDAIVEKAMTLCDAAFGMFNTFDGERFHTVATRGIPEAYARFRAASPPDYGPGSAPFRLIAGEDCVHEADMTDHDLYRGGDPNRRSIVDLGGARTILNIALRKEGILLGMIAIYRREVRPFTDKQIALLQGFAGQAVIAMDNARLLTELRESLEYQTATSDVLSVISRSTSELEPVLNSMLAAATRLCGVQMGGVAVRRGDVLRYLTSTGVSAEFDKWLRETPHPVDRTSVAGRAAADKRIAYIPDVAADPDYAMPHTTTVGNMQSLLGVPLMREGEAVGVIVLGRSDREPFTERQIALVRTFADQAVIAMENTRLLADLRESLDYQTAMSEVLEVISRSTSDLAPVLNTMLAAAAHLCGVEKGDVSIRRDGQMRYAASIGTSAAEDAWLRSRIIKPDRSTCAGRAMVTRQAVHVLDQSADPELAVPRQISAHQTVLSVPLLREGEPIGVITVLRDHVEAFTERQIALIKTFADQAVIAIENARLLGELRERTDDLTESLEYQTATSDLLEVISRSTSDIQPVFDRMLASAARLCGVEKGDVAIRQGDAFRHVAFIGATPEELAWLKTRVTTPGRTTSTARALLERRIDHVHDQSRDPERVAPAIATAARTTLAVPLLREGEAIGVISLLRDRVEPFTERQIALIETFADQAVIAMENARLLGELRERQNELRVTFDNMGDAVVMFDAERRLAAWNRNFQEMLDVSDAFLAARPTLDDYVRLLIERGELGEVDIDSEMVRFRERFEQQWSAERTRPNGRILEVRNNPVPGGGAVLIYSDITERKKSEAAIRSARDAAEAALAQLKAAQANLVQSEKMASLGQLTAGIAHEIKNPLNFVNNFATLSVELLDELKEIAGPALETLEADKRAELDETMGLLTGNLGKIAEHGKRADGIVRSMLSHSRGGSGDWQASDINALVEEALNLAYHGARAQDKEFNVTLERQFATDSKPIEVVPQDVTRVFLNLFGNGFYAANKRRLAKETGFRPTLKVTTRETGEAVEVRVRDNGIGIPPEVREKLFQPFFTTKPTGEGTGLGLSISYDIVTQQHGGTIGVESEVGNFTEFTVRLPRIPRVASAKRA